MVPRGPATSAIAFPGRIRRMAASKAVLPAASTSACRPVTGALASSCTNNVCAAVATKPSMWVPRSLRRHEQCKVGQSIAHFSLLQASLMIVAMLSAVKVALDDLLIHDQARMQEDCLLFKTLWALDTD